MQDAKPDTAVGCAIDALDLTVLDVHGLLFALDVARVRVRRAPARRLRHHVFQEQPALTHQPDSMAARGRSVSARVRRTAPRAAAVTGATAPRPSVGSTRNAAHGTRTATTSASPM